MYAKNDYDFAEVEALLLQVCLDRKKWAKEIDHKYIHYISPNKWYWNWKKGALNGAKSHWQY